MRKCSLESLDRVFSAIAADMPLYLPVDQTDGSAAYSRWKEGVVWSDKLNTNRSPKDFFFPQTENMMAFKTEGKNIEIIDTREELEDFVIFGVRPCDVRSFEVLDNVFLHTEPVDSYYANRRAHGVIVSVACSKPSETCFCGTFGIDATAPAGDIAAWKTEDSVYFTANTEKGKALLAKIEALTEECDTAAVDAQKEKTAAILNKLPFAALTTAGFGAVKPKHCLTIRRGRTCLKHVWAAAPVRLCARPASVTTSKILTPATV